MSSRPLLSICHEEVIFAVELQKPAYCNVKVINFSKHYVAFKVKTTSPEKYFMRPNTSVLLPWDTVTLQAQKELPPDLECKDKFFIQSTILPPHLLLNDIPPDLFNKDDNKGIEECTLRISYVRYPSIVRDPHILKNPRAEEDLDHREYKMSSEPLLPDRLQEQLASTREQNKLLQREILLGQNKFLEQELELQRLRGELAYAVQQIKLLDQKMEMPRRSSIGRTIAFVGWIGLLIGILLNLALF